MDSIESCSFEELVSTNQDGQAMVEGFSDSSDKDIILFSGNDGHGEFIILITIDDLDSRGFLEDRFNFFQVELVI